MNIVASEVGDKTDLIIKDLADKAKDNKMRVEGFKQGVGEVPRNPESRRHGKNRWNTAQTGEMESFKIKEAPNQQDKSIQSFRRKGLNMSSSLAVSKTVNYWSYNIYVSEIFSTWVCCKCCEILSVVYVVSGWTFGFCKMQCNMRKRIKSWKTCNSFCF